MKNLIQKFPNLIGYLFAWRSFENYTVEISYMEILIQYVWDWDLGNYILKMISTMHSLRATDLATK